MARHNLPFVFIIAALASPPSSFPFPYLDPSLSLAARTANLISLLNTSEKVALLNADAPALPRISLPPYSIARECERGDTGGPHGTLFPSGAGLAASWDADLVGRVARFTALEARANANMAGVGASSSCFGPVINFVHDSRWGRTNEMLTGEDTTPGAALGEAFVRGLQSWTQDTAQGTRYAVSSTVKHLLSYSGPEGRGFTFGPFATRFSFEANFSSQRAWREFFLPAFRGVAKAGAKGFMCSYSSFSTPDGYLRNAPACGSSHLLTDTLRGLWQWDGFVLSDAGAVAFIGQVAIGGVPFGHNFTSSNEASAIAAVEAGCDVELTCCGAPRVFPSLVESAAEGNVREAVLDAALSRVIRNRIELGTLDPPGTYPWGAWGSANVTTPEMVELSAAAAASGVVLMKNAGGLLPLSPASLAGRKLALIGPVGNDTYAMMGGYGNTHPPFVRTILDGLSEAFPLSTLLFDAGCVDSTACSALSASTMALAAQGDVIVAALGTTGFFKPGGANNESGACGCPDGNAIEGECCDRNSTALPGKQLALLQALAALGKPLVLILNSGGILDSAWAAAASGVNAILHAPFLGMSAGVGVARVLSGATNPSGKTTLSWYRDAAALPPLADYSDGSLYARTYRYSNAEMTFPFGYG